MPMKELIAPGVYKCERKMKKKLQNSLPLLVKVLTQQIAYVFESSFFLQKRFLFRNDLRKDNSVLYLVYIVYILICLTCRLDRVVTSFTQTIVRHTIRLVPTCTTDATLHFLHPPQHQLSICNVNYQQIGTIYFKILNIICRIRKDNSTHREYRQLKS